MRSGPGREPSLGFRSQGSPLTLRRQEVSKQHQAGNEYTRYNDVNDVKERLPTDDERVDDVSFSGDFCRASLIMADRAWAVVDGPFSILCRAWGCSQPTYLQLQAERVGAASGRWGVSIREVWAERDIPSQDVKERGLV